MKVQVTTPTTMPTSRLWKPFTIPRKFLDATWKSSTAPIFRLPTEILIQIFNDADPLDQYSLALVCKRLLQVSSLVSFKTSWLVGSPVRDHSERRMEALLRTIKPMNKAGRRQRKAWLICIDCLQFRPTRKSYWDRKKKKESLVAAAAVAAAVAAVHGGPGLCEEAVASNYWDAYIRSWMNRATLQCPNCRFEEQVLEPQRVRIRLWGGSCPGPAGPAEESSSS